MLLRWYVDAWVELTTLALQLTRFAMALGALRIPTRSAAESDRGFKYQVQKARHDVV